MNSESGLNHTAVNRHGGATGLIQFMPATAREMFGLSTAQLRAMTNVQQLDYVERFYMYWKNQGAEFKRFSDLYLVAFLPAWATNKKPDSTTFSNTIKKANGFYSRGINNLGDWRKYVENKAKKEGLTDIKKKVPLDTDAPIDRNGRNWNGNLLPPKSKGMEGIEERLEEISRELNKFKEATNLGINVLQDKITRFRLWTSDQYEIGDAIELNDDTSDEYQFDVLLGLHRIKQKGESTLSVFGEMKRDRLDDWCYCLEDKLRHEKIYGQTAIPEGIYPIRFRKEGRLYHKYQKKYKGVHQTPGHGMLEIGDIINFRWVMFHIGNFIWDTKGCPLTGTGYYTHNGHFAVSQSTKAYEKVYPKTADWLLEDLKIGLEVKNDPSLKVY